MHLQEKRFDKTEITHIIEMMNKTIIIAMLALVTVFSSVAVSAVTNEVFTKNEVVLDLGGNYDSDATTQQFGGTLGLKVFPFTKYFGVEASSSVRDLQDTFFDNARAEGVFRIPFDKQHVALELGGGARYEFAPADYQYGAVGRVVYRLNPKWEVYSGYRYDIERQNLPNRQEIIFGLGLVF